MTNEELVMLVQAGDNSKLPELWEQVERFVAKKANRRMVLAGGFGGVEYEDLCQSGYLALVAAADSYDPAAGKSFVGWLSLMLKTAFAEAGGYRSHKQAHDPLHRAGSLDVPVSEDSDITPADLIVDPAAEADIEAVAEQDRLERLRAAVESALAQLPEDQQAAIRRRYYDAPALPAGPEREQDKAAYGAALRALRHPRISRLLESAS